jgi:hypothetical protein
VVVQSAGNWTAVITLAQTAPYGAGKIFAMSFSALLPQSSPVASTVDCQSGPCAQLPDNVPGKNQPLAGDLRCTPSAAQAAQFNLGGIEVSLPVRATFVPKWSVGPGSYVDATSLGLPLAALTSDTIPNPGTEPTPGPGGGPGLEFSLAGGLPPLVYERRLTPLAPFDSAYPPDVAIVDLTATPQPSEDPVWEGFDATIGTNPDGNPELPKFELNRADGGSIDGWTAYLRDAVTLRNLSQVAQLSGTESSVTLLTNHHPAPMDGKADALTGAQLVLAPPPGSPLPTWLYTPVNGSLIDSGTFPKLPPAVSAQIQVVDHLGRPTPADLVFEAVDMCRYALNGTAPVHDLLSANHDFSFVTRASADAGTATVQLPLGGYRVTAIPRSGGAALTVLNPLSLADPHCNPQPLKPIQLLQTSVVTGIASVADLRPLADATIEFVPTVCADGEVDPSCLPRWAQTITSTGGAFSTPLDPGTYLLRVRPAQGSGLPWVVQPLIVTSTATTMAPVTTVPAPVPAGLQLFDALGNPAADALVQIFENPASGNPYEIGEAVADATGHFDMYLDPAAQ